jgi:hypothetical protein
MKLVFFFLRISKNTQILSFIKIRSLRVKLFYFGRTDRQTEGRTYITNLTVTFLNVVNAAKASYTPTTEYQKLETRKIEV